MSVDVTHYLGIGYQVDYDENIDKVDAFLDAHPEYSEYSFQNPGADKPGLQIITDGMNGGYIYIMYVLHKAEQEDMYGYSGSTEISLSGISSGSPAAVLVRDLFNSVMSYDPEMDPYLVSLFHCA